MLSYDEMLGNRRSKKHYFSIKRKALNTSISWNLTFEEWCRIWVESGKFALAGDRGIDYNLRRKNDSGSFSLNNIVVAKNCDQVIEYTERDVPNEFHHCNLKYLYEYDGVFFPRLSALGGILNRSRSRISEMAKKGQIRIWRYVPKKRIFVTPYGDFETRSDAVRAIQVYEAGFSSNALYYRCNYSRLDGYTVLHKNERMILILHK